MSELTGNKLVDKGLVSCLPSNAQRDNAVQLESPEISVTQAAEGYTLLEQLEAEGVEVPYQCREGYCGRCRTKKVSGEVAYTSAPLAWVNPGEVLPCCCVAVSEVVLALDT
ncbi:class I ribonucleotide reductase maintenance protein YfaE [Corallincola spongiicola]|uniref:2Fe-2S ferredoxin-like protein n=1 Tax=Corallincola spongiicola TaxID=2520508 RepID=A0ABY1WQQ8_9GAMM|nr:class I ribonucleotide reductase maintenance protein YfaE [Corallincola spongiicola]TAA47048.1 2Fe-2S ferredoxin-like protein [Corallincola spongiicola]